MVNIIYTKFIAPLPETVFKTYLQELPLAMQEKNAKYLRWQDKHAHLLGKLLLINGLHKFGYGKHVLSEMKYTAHDKPYLENDIEFNISHTAGLVVLAINKKHPLGVDVEAIKPIMFENFNAVMNPEEWNTINNATNKIEAFYKHWVVKESVIKADGKGLSIPLLDIKIDNTNQINYKNKVWYTQSLQLEEGYCASIATEKASVLYTLDYEDNLRLLNR